MDAAALPGCRGALFTTFHTPAIRAAQFTALITGCLPKASLLEVLASSGRNTAFRTGGLRSWAPVSATKRQDGLADKALGPLNKPLAARSLPGCGVGPFSAPRGGQLCGCSFPPPPPDPSRVSAPEIGSQPPLQGKHKTKKTQAVLHSIL